VWSQFANRAGMWGRPISNLIASMALARESPAFLARLDGIRRPAAVELGRDQRVFERQRLGRSESCERWSTPLRPIS